MMKLYAPFIKEVTLRVTMTLRSEGHGGDPSPKLQGHGEALKVSRKVCDGSARMVSAFLMVEILRMEGESSRATNRAERGGGAG